MSMARSSTDQVSRVGLADVAPAWPGAGADAEVLDARGREKKVSNRRMVRGAEAVGRYPGIRWCIAGWYRAVLGKAGIDGVT